MSREELIQHTVDRIQKLPENKIMEVSDFAEFLLSRMDDEILTSGVQLLTARSSSYEFLKQEDDLYTVNDLKERYR